MPTASALLTAVPRHPAEAPLVITSDLTVAVGSSEQLLLLLRGSGVLAAVASVVFCRARQDAGLRPEGRPSRPEDSIDAAGCGSD